MIGRTNYFFKTHHIAQTPSDRISRPPNPVQKAITGNPAPKHSMLGVACRGHFFLRRPAPPNIECLGAGLPVIAFCTGLFGQFPA
jgi:hypothetical protein